MAYAQLYRAPRLTLLYAHHSILGPDDTIHARYGNTGHAPPSRPPASMSRTARTGSPSFRDLVVGEVRSGVNW
nr:hypothetical protein [Devosia limi]